MPDAVVRDHIFISYRRDDARGASGRLYDWFASLSVGNACSAMSTVLASGSGETKSKPPWRRARFVSLSWVLDGRTLKTCDACKPSPPAK